MRDTLSPMVHVLVSEAPDEIVAREAALREAQLRGDVGALDALIAEDLLFAGPDGNLASKADDLAAHASGAVRFAAHEPEELRVRRVTDDVYVTSLRARLTVEAGRATISGTYRYTRVWAREGGSWRVVAGHVAACER